MMTLVEAIKLAQDNAAMGAAPFGDIVATAAKEYLAGCIQPLDNIFGYVTFKEPKSCKFLSDGEIVCMTTVRFYQKTIPGVFYLSLIVRLRENPIWVHVATTDYDPENIKPGALSPKYMHTGSSYGLSSDNLFIGLVSAVAQTLLGVVHDHAPKQVPEKPADKMQEFTNPPSPPDPDSESGKEPTPADSPATPADDEICVPVLEYEPDEKPQPAESTVSVTLDEVCSPSAEPVDVPEPETPPVQASGYDLLRDDELVRIGDQVWMNHNLHWKADPEHGIYEVNGETYFTWEAAVRVAKQFESMGFRLPSREDWEKLSAFCGGTYAAGKHLKSTSGWTIHNGLDSYGFCGKPAGRFSTTICKLKAVHTRGYFWSSTPPVEHDKVYPWYLHSTNARFEEGYYSASSAGGLSVRLVKDAVPDDGNGVTPKPHETPVPFEAEKFSDWELTKIGDQVWMTHNLHVPADPEHGIYVKDGNTYFTWEAAVRISKRYEALGFRLPSRKDWQELIDFCGGKDSAGNQLKSISGWKTGNGNNGYYFDGKPTGWLSPDTMQVECGGEYGYFWTSTARLLGGAYYMRLSGDGTADIQGYEHKELWFSVRLVKDAGTDTGDDSPGKPEETPAEPARTDTDGFRDDELVTIGNQVWLNHNLQVPADPEHGIYAKDGETYFTWEAAVRVAKQFESTGFRLPSREDWNELSECCGGDSSAGMLLKSRCYWENMGGKDTYGFNGKPAGAFRPQNGTVGDAGRGTTYWSAEEAGFATAYARTLVDNCSDFYEHAPYNAYGMSVRLVKDAWTYTGDDSPGKPEETPAEPTTPGTNGFRDDELVKIGDQVWLNHSLHVPADPEHGIYEEDGNTYFTWDAAMRVAKQFEPFGFRLPSRDDWLKLAQACGGYDLAGKKLKSTAEWDGCDSYGFNAIPAVRYVPGIDECRRAGEVYFWSSTKDGDGCVSMFLCTGYTGFNASRCWPYFGLPVRLVKDAGNGSRRSQYSSVPASATSSPHPGKEASNV